MKVFVNFENAILLNSIYYESVLVAIRNFGTNFRKHTEKVALNSLSYNPKTISILEDNYKENKIFILHESKNKIFAEMFKDQFSNSFKFISLVEFGDNKLETILNIEKDFHYISGSLNDYNIIKFAKESSMVSNIFSNFIHLIISNKSKDSRTTLFNGVFTSFFNHLYLIFPIFAVWPCWMEVDPQVINLSKIK